MLKSSLIAKTDAKANKSQVYMVDGVRITYLTPRLIRVESGGKFTDLPSSVVWFRNFDEGAMKVSKKGFTFTVETEEVIFTIKKYKPYSIYFKDSGKTEVFCKQKNLKGTRRTLDMTFGKVPLSDGLITKNGAYVLDDSNSLLIDESGHFIPREKGTKDYYAFAYGKNYREAIKAFYQISSPVPLIPRFALGVWWSRYHAYTQQEYLNLMARFKKEDIPLTVATVDMDWHWVDVRKQFNEKYRGWTGYSWNTQLFPDYKEFLKELKDNNLHITLNLHPADGVRAYEDMYENMAKAVGIDPKTKEKIEFKCGSDDFWNAYFDVLHKPYEKDGVGFWWIDWQQGKKSDVKGLDPLTALNHYHFLDNAENGQMPLILSRYAGLGSHRYPLGFSGDTGINWKVLDFQPYFTATAANSAYTWWSHDIGGHHMGFRDDDLYMRWIQFGVFSPILRLHSSASDLLGKEPWKYRNEICKCAKDFLRFRHALIPYLYTMDYRTHNDGIALCEPMYYSYPENSNAYMFKNQYMFGSELMICPITSKQSKETNMGEVKSWIPKGRWTDIFTGQSYEGEKILPLCRDIDSIPVLAKEGAIIPFSMDEGNSTDNPKQMEIWVYAGNNTFTIYEDNNKIDYNCQSVKTLFENYYDKEKEIAVFTVNPAVGDTFVIPKERFFRIILKDITAESVTVSDDANIYEDNNGCPIIEFKSSENPVVIKAIGAKYLQPRPLKERLEELFSRWQEKTIKKEIAYKCFRGKNNHEDLIKALQKSHLPNSVNSAITECLLQQSESTEH